MHLSIHLRYQNFRFDRGIIRNVLEFLGIPGYAIDYFKLYEIGNDIRRQKKEMVTSHEKHIETTTMIQTTKNIIDRNSVKQLTTSSEISQRDCQLATLKTSVVISNEENKDML